YAAGHYDPQTGLVRYGARDYDAALGRWLAKDPILIAGGDTNLYAYVTGDPVNFVDPTGNNPMILILAGGLTGGVAGFVGSEGCLRNRVAGAITGAITGASIAAGIHYFSTLLVASDALALELYTARATGGFFGGTTGNLGGQMFSQAVIDGELSSINTDEVFASGIVGATGAGLIGGWTGGVVSSGEASLGRELLGWSLFGGVDLAAAKWAAEQGGPPTQRCGCESTIPTRDGLAEL
ncbi:MAG: RHS repeat-associated core domain-containing protein, partial [Myxococcota bacterium]|nr:RHS repeat-associated core domain-containing protein [Myxococcota bacterium]